MHLNYGYQWSRVYFWLRKDLWFMMTISVTCYLFCSTSHKEYIANKQQDTSEIYSYFSFGTINQNNVNWLSSSTSLRNTKKNFLLQKHLRCLHSVWKNITWMLPIFYQWMRFVLPLFFHNLVLFDIFKETPPLKRKYTTLF